ncbi:unnamed protein product, partial [Sphagnum compactum]
LFALYWKSIMSWFNSGANLMCMQVKEIFLYCELNFTSVVSYWTKYNEKVIPVHTSSILHHSALV